ncbi:hypothetical protein B0H13DRAFT_2386284 [Mycena leptocephala]|nr:hypothetical protein B0H13DRAFT_2386284 [Mycena leptocephala]
MQRFRIPNLLRSFIQSSPPRTQSAHELRANSQLDPPAPYRDFWSPDFLRDVWNDWHKTSVPLPEDWSTEWARWEHTCRFNPMNTDRGQLKFCIKDKSVVHTRTIEPLAYTGENTMELMFVFSAGGQYYYYDGPTGIMWEYEGEFTDHDDFLRRTVNIPRWPICSGDRRRKNSPWLEYS